MPFSSGHEKLVTDIAVIMSRTKWQHNILIKSCTLYTLFLLLPGQVADLDRFLSAYENNEICSIIIKYMYSV